MKEFAKEMGLTAHYHTAAIETAMTKDLDDLQGLMKILPPKSFCLIGGGAIVAHYGKESRLISPDLDLMLNTTAAKTLLENKDQFSLRNNMFGLTLNTKDLGIDLIFAKRAYEAEAVAQAEQKKVGGVTIPVISLPYLILIKLKAGRDKDVEDVELIFSLAFKQGQKAYDDLAEKSQALVKKYASQQQYDLKSSILLGKLKATL